MRRARILVADDEGGMRDFLGILLRKEGYHVTLATSGREALMKAQESTFDLLISDIRMPDLSGIDLLREVRSSSPETMVVLITAYASTQTAVAALKLGAHDYVTKPFDVDEFRIVVSKTLESKRLRDENVSLRQELQNRRELEKVISASPAMRQVLEVVERVAETAATVLLQGERGTGKEVIARTIHESSHRRRHRFVSVNCAAIQESLLESELFGYNKGAFTGATSAHEGLFETAEGGTILLDEVSEMSMHMQTKLLRVLQEKAVRRVGGTEEIPVDVRVIASTNRDLEAQVEAQQFRADLYDRLNVIAIRVPPLRERREDIAPLVEHFLHRASQEMGRQVTSIEPEALALLERQEWPGNVRELENLIRRAVALGTSSQLRVADIPDLGRGSTPEATARAGAGAEPGGLPGLPIELGVEEGQFDLEQHLDALRKQYIAEALSRSGGKLVDAARLLGISFRALRYYAKKYQLR